MAISSSAPTSSNGRSGTDPVIRCHHRIATRLSDCRPGLARPVAQSVPNWRYPRQAACLAVPRGLNMKMPTHPGSPPKLQWVTGTQSPQSEPANRLYGAQAPLRTLCNRRKPGHVPGFFVIPSRGRSQAEAITPAVRIEVAWDPYGRSRYVVLRVSKIAHAELSFAACAFFAPLPQPGGL